MKISDLYATILDVYNKYYFKVYKILDNWIWELLAFILLPLIIYFLMFIFLDVQFIQVIKLPEWMFISIILYADSLKKIIHYEKNNDKDFEESSTKFISFAIIGVTISSVLLALSIVDKYKEFELPIIYYYFELFVFAIAIILSAYFELIIKMKIKFKSIYD